MGHQPQNLPFGILVSDAPSRGVLGRVPSMFLCAEPLRRPSQISSAALPPRPVDSRMVALHVLVFDGGLHVECAGIILGLVAG